MFSLLPLFHEVDDNNRTAVPAHQLVEMLPGHLSVRILSLNEYLRLRLYLGDVLGPVGGHGASHVDEAGVVAHRVAANAGVTCDLLSLHLVLTAPAGPPGLGL